MATSTSTPQNQPLQPNTEALLGGVILMVLMTVIAWMRNGTSFDSALLLLAGCVVVYLACHWLEESPKLLVGLVAALMPGYWLIADSVEPAAPPIKIVPPPAPPGKKPPVFRIHVPLSAGVPVPTIEKVEAKRDGRHIEFRAETRSVQDGFEVEVRQPEAESDRTGVWVFKVPVEDRDRFFRCEVTPGETAGVIEVSHEVGWFEVSATGARCRAVPEDRLIANVRLPGLHRSSARIVLSGEVEFVNPVAWSGVEISMQGVTSVVLGESPKRCVVKVGSHRVAVGKVELRKHTRHRFALTLDNRSGKTSHLSLQIDGVRVCSKRLTRLIEPPREWRVRLTSYGSEVIVRGVNVESPE